MKTSLDHCANRYRRQTVLAAGTLILAVISAGRNAQAQTTYTYYTGTSNAYLNASHWLIGGANGTASTKFPGLSGSTAAAGANGTSSDIAAFGAVNASVNSIGINFATSGNTGTGSSNAGASGTLSVGAFDFLTQLQNDLTFGNSSTTAGATGILTLNGDSLNSINDTIISDEGTHNVIFSPSISTSTNKPVLAIALGDATTNTIQANGTGNITISAVIQNGAGNSVTVNSAGTGAVIFSGANTYTGTTTVTNGTLLANGTGTAGTSSALGTGAVTVNGGTVGGTGTISGAVTVNSGGIVQGGLSTLNGAANGTLTLSSLLTLNTGSAIQIAIGSNFGHSTLATSGVTFASGQVFNIIETAITTTGTYPNIISGLTSDPGTESTWVANGSYGGFMANFTYDAAGGIDLNVTAVPEPTTVLGGGLLIAAAAWSQRRRLRGGVAA